MPTFKFLSTFLLAVAALSHHQIPVWSAAAAETKETQLHAPKLTLRHRRRSNVININIDSAVIRHSKNPSFTVNKAGGIFMSKREEPHNEKLDFYNVLDEEWERLLDRKGGCLSFSMAPTPSVAPPVDPLPPPTPRAPSSPTPAPIDDSNTSMAPDAATPSSPISSPSSPISSPGGTETVAPSTFQPPACEELDRADAILASVRSISPDVDPNDTESPSGFAVNWITNDDEAQRNPCTDDILPRYALVTLYAATQGTFWTNQTGWLTKESECEWYAVTCNDENQVESLELRMNNLAGTIPNELVALGELQTLVVYANSVTGTLPSVINRLTNLQMLDVEENQLTGPAFVDVSNLENLQSYRVSINSLTGTMPTDWPASPSLGELWFAGNPLTGTLTGSTIGAFTQLSSLIMYNTGLTGTLPSELGLLTGLEQLQLQNNAFASTIPEDLYRLGRLQDLRLDSNKLAGTISSGLGDLTELRDLRIGGNLFTGTLPPQIARLSNLGILYVNDTKLEGIIRDAFEPFQSLRFADFTGNMFTGPLPSSIFNIPSIEILYFSENMITGSIPSNYGNAANLRDLYLNDNRLIGMVPPIDPGQLAMLTELRLENNELTGSMPASICALRGDNATSDLVALIADCGGATPQIKCDCCNSCNTN